MTLQEDLVSALEDDAGVGVVIGDRIYPLSFPTDATFPCVTYSTITAPVEQAVDRTVHAQRSGIQVDHWAETYASAKASAAAARAALLGMAGNTVDLHEVRLWNEMDSRDADSGLYRHMQEWWFVHS